MPSALPARLRRAVPRVRLTRRRVIAGSVVLVLLLAVVGWAVRPKPASYRTTDRFLTVRTGPGDDQEVALDTTFYVPKLASAAHPVPAVLLAHGFGGTKQSVADDAKDLADHGFAVLAWTAQGFGRSTGQVHVDSPDWEVKDAQRLIDWLATRPEVRQDAPGDPRVAAVGGSYGGGLALMLAGYDRRLDAIVPQITWNDLARSFLPESTGAAPVDGVFKKQWAGLFFGSANTGGSSADLGGAGGATGGGGADAASGGAAPTAVPSGAPSTGGAPPGSGAPGGGAPGRGGLGGLRAGNDPQCGRFARDICDAYLSIASTGRSTAEEVALLRRSSPSTVLDRITAPTLLIQGEADSLFPLSEADANARGIAAHGTPVRVAWFTGGHDGGTGPQSDIDRLRFLTVQWLDHYLTTPGPRPRTASPTRASPASTRAATASLRPASRSSTTPAPLGRPLWTVAARSRSPRAGPGPRSRRR